MFFPSREYKDILYYFMRHPNRRPSHTNLEVGYQRYYKAKCGSEARSSDLAGSIPGRSRICRSSIGTRDIRRDRKAIR